MDFTLTLVASLCSFFLGLCAHHLFVKKFIGGLLINIGSEKMFQHMASIIKNCVETNNSICTFKTEKEEFTLKIVEVKNVKS